MMRIKTLFSLGIWVALLTQWICVPTFAQPPSRLHKKQLPSTAVQSDQSNTYSGGDQDFGTAVSLRIKTGSGTPPAADCNAAAKVGRLYARSDAGSAGTTLFICSNTAPGTFGWEQTGSGINVLV